MGLSQELLLYAENIYRRFPEEFMALGMPGLEEIYDLRPDGTRSRRISETSSEKCVEITLRRWHQPPAWPGSYPQAPLAPWARPDAFYMGHAHMGAHMATHVGAHGAYYRHYEAPSAPAPAPPAPQSNHLLAGTEDPASTQRLERLEAALQSLKPHIQALLSSQAGQKAAQPAQSPHSAQQGQPIQQATGLGSRRNLDTLKIQTSTPHVTPQGDSSNSYHKATVKSAEAEPPRVASTVSLSPSKAAQAPENLNFVTRSLTTPAHAEEPEKVDRGRPKVSVNPVRVAPNATDPASPRSPGRYSAWK